jgi:hypothetical protein
VVPAHESLISIASYALTKLASLGERLHPSVPPTSLISNQGESFAWRRDISLRDEQEIKHRYENYHLPYLHPNHIQGTWAVVR